MVLQPQSWATDLIPEFISSKGCGSFNEAVSHPGLVYATSTIKEAAVVYLNVLSGLILRKTRINLSQHSRYPGKGSNRDTCPRRYRYINLASVGK